MPDQQLYDRIGRDYASIRKADRRWAAAILSAVGNATTVLNVGAGAGSYEPTDRPVIALDPSVYFIDHLPVRVEPLDLGVIVAASIVVAVLATIYPARQAAGLTPVEAIRHQ